MPQFSPPLNELNTFVQKMVMPGITDNFFKNDPLLKYFQTNVPVPFTGGSGIQENFLYGKLPGGAYEGSGPFDTSARQVAQGGVFQPKQYYSGVTVFKEDFQVRIKGPEAKADYLDHKMVAAALGMSAQLALALYHHGTGARSAHLNGLAEAINDGLANSWTGGTFTTYGGVTRNGDVGKALNSVPLNVAGPITFPVLEESYSDAVIGVDEPNLGITTNLGYAFIKEQFQPQERFTEEDITIGFRGLRLNGAIIMRSQYAPGTKGDSADEGFETDNLAAAGETLWFLNTNYWRMFITNDPEFAFGFSGFKPAQDDNSLVGQLFFIGNVTCQSPRLQKQLFGITG